MNTTPPKALRANTTSPRISHPQNLSAPVPPHPSFAQRASAVQPRRAPVALPVYRPQSVPKVLQGKMAGNGQKVSSVQLQQTQSGWPPARPSPAARGAVQAKSVSGNTLANHRSKLITAVQPSIIQRRGYANSAIDDFINTNRAAFVRGDGDNSVDVNAMTALFRSTHQYQDRDDLRYLRKQVNNHRSLLNSHPAVITRPLTAGFRAHVRGDTAGVGWHTELVNANGDPNYSYVNWGWISQSKGTYWATALVINGTAKVGNNGNGTFFPTNMSLALIEEEAEYVANSYPQAGQLVIGRGRKTGIMIECIIRLNQVESAYPYKPGW